MSVFRGAGMSTLRFMRRATVCLILAGFLCLPALAAASGPPTIVGAAPSNVRNHEATIQFSIDPEGLETEYEFEYGREAGTYYPFHYLWDGTLPAGDEAVLREAKLPAYFEGGLFPGTEYHYRVVARNAAGTTEGPDEVFTTSNEPAPVLTTSPVSEATTANVHFEGTVNPEGNPLTGCRFRWVTDSVFHNAGFEKWNVVAQA